METIDHLKTYEQQMALIRRIEEAAAHLANLAIWDTEAPNIVRADE